MHLFIIDTDTYAGNFWRELCAFVTGQVSECGVGEEAASHTRGEIGNEILAWFSENVVRETDDSGCARPVKIWTTPGQPDDCSVAILLDAPPPEKIAALMRGRALTFASDETLCRPFRITGFRLVQERVIYEEERSWPA